MPIHEDPTWKFLNLISASTRNFPQTWSRNNGDLSIAKLKIARLTRSFVNGKLGRTRDPFTSIASPERDRDFPWDSRRIMANRNSRTFSDDPMVNTDFPVKRYTAVQYTQPAAAMSPLSKSTRHLLVPEPDPRYYYTHRAHQETITIDRDNLKHGKEKAYPYEAIFTSPSETDSAVRDPDILLLFLERKRLWSYGRCLMFMKRFSFLFSFFLIIIQLASTQITRVSRGCTRDFWKNHLPKVSGTVWRFLWSIRCARYFVVIFPGSDYSNISKLLSLCSYVFVFSIRI